MSLTLDTRSSSVVDGRCTGCGQFISRDTSHFHGPKRKFRGRPRVHLFRFGEGGLVTRCDDVRMAHDLIVYKYAREEFGKSFDNLDDEDRLDVLRQFPFERGIVERGRFRLHGGSPQWRGLSWYALPDDARGPGVTTAVVW